MPNVRMPDGTVVGFPDDMPREQIKGMIAQKFPQLNESTFASGTKQRMAEYQGLSPEQAASKARGQLGQTLKGAAETAIGAINPVQLGRQIGQAPQAISNIAKAIPNIPRYYYENPDVFATDVAFGITPLGPETEAFRGARAVEQAIPKIVSPAERAAGMKAEAGAGMQAIKEGAAPIPADTLLPVVKKLKEDAGDYYTTDRIKHVFGKLEELLPKKPFYRSPEMTKAQTQIEALGGEKFLARQKPEVRARIEEATKAQGGGKIVSVNDLHKVQQGLKSALSSPESTDRAVGMSIKNSIDDFVENHMGEQGWTAEKRKYAAASIALEMKGLQERAAYRATQLSAGQQGAALATEFRNWARPMKNGMPNKNMRMLRGVNPEAADKVELFAKGELPFDKLLRILGTAAPSNIMNVGMAELAGHLLHGLIGTHIGPMGIMITGAGARYLRGARAAAHVDDIINTILDEAEFGDKLGAFEQKVGAPVAEAVSKTPAGNRALRAWAKKAGPQSARVLALMIARTVKRPDLAPRIQQELENMDQDNNGRTDSVTPTVSSGR